MAVIHEALYRSDDLARIDFADYVRQVGDHLLKTYRLDSQHIALTVTASDVRLDTGSAIYCGLIANELISNAIQHAFPDGRAGEIQVGLESGQAGELTLSVTDTGVGLPASLEIPAADTFGLQLVNMLVKQLDGTIEIDRENGTAIRVAFNQRPGAHTDAA
jgi:two-component sensor histidine kinase